MESRIAKIEAALPGLATKADVEKASQEVTKWLVRTMIGCVGMFVVIITFVLNNATPRAPPAAAEPLPPILIQLPASPAPPTPP